MQELQGGCLSTELAVECLLELGEGIWTEAEQLASTAHIPAGLSSLSLAP